jgi:hypothetical protein
VHKSEKQVATSEKKVCNLTTPPIWVEVTPKSILTNYGMLGDAINYASFGFIATGVFVWNGFENGPIFQVANRKFNFGMYLKKMASCL